MFHRTQKLERLRSIKIVNTLIEKAMCKVCLETEVPEGQRGANTTRSWFCHWVEISAPGEWIHFPCYSTVSFFSNNLLLSHREDPPAGWLVDGSHSYRLMKADRHPAALIKVNSRLLAPWPPSWDLLVPVTTHLLLGCFPIVWSHWCLCPGTGLGLPDVRAFSRFSSSCLPPAPRGILCWAWSFFKYHYSFRPSSPSLPPEHTGEAGQPAPDGSHLPQRMPVERKASGETFLFHSAVTFLGKRNKT